MEIILNKGPEGRKQLLEALKTFAEENGIGAEPLQAADLALEEHLTNVFTHGFEATANGKVTVRLSTEPSWLKLEVEDNGKPFNPLAQPEVDISRSLAEKEIGGLGIHLMRRFMDRLDYSQRGDVNILTMWKKLQ